MLNDCRKILNFLCTHNNVNKTDIYKTLKKSWGNAYYNIDLLHNLGMIEIISEAKESKLLITERGRGEVFFLNQSALVKLWENGNYVKMPELQS